MKMPVRISRSVLLMVLLAGGHGASAELHPRLDGAAAYDDVLDVTWLTDAALSGNGSWQGQLDWIAALNSDGHLGFTDWRLASMSVSAGLPTGLAADIVDCSTIWPPLCTDNELGYMFFHNLGGSTGELVTGTRTVGDVTIQGIQELYWSATESGITNAWMYHFDIGFGVWSPKNGVRYAWAVRDGDVQSADTDGDGVADEADNCLVVANGDQRDSDADGFGNACDADLNGDCVVNALDLGLFRAQFFCTGADTACTITDFSGDGVTNAVDLGILKSGFFQAPGPSGASDNCGG